MPRFLFAALLTTAGCAADGQGSAPMPVEPSVLSASPSSQAAPRSEGEDLRRRLGTTDLGVALTAGPAGAGGTRQVAVTVRNCGPNPATGVLVSITVAGAADIRSLPAGCGGPADATIVCDLGEIPSQGLVERVLTLQPRSRITVLAHARSSRGTDEEPANDRAQLTM